jgi:hypothetical protein
VTDYSFVIAGASLAWVVYGVVQSLKSAKWLANKYAQFAAIIVGVALSYAYEFYPTMTVPFIRGAAVATTLFSGYTGVKWLAKKTEASQ